ncbi:hypothetical protein Tco_0449542 [Tanacetum coccineum]
MVSQKMKSSVKTFDRSRSSLGLHVKFKAGSKSCSLSKQDSYIKTRVGITIPPSYSNAEDNSKKLFYGLILYPTTSYFNFMTYSEVIKVVRLGLNLLIQPEPEIDLPKEKDN